jgi:transposase
MNIHKNARLTPWGREQAVRRVLELGQSARQVGRDLATTEATVRKWVARVRSGADVHDRSSRPHANPHAIAPAVALRIEVLRRQRRTCAEIATAVGVSRATVARIVARCGWRASLQLRLVATQRLRPRQNRAVVGYFARISWGAIPRLNRNARRPSLASP